MPIDHSRLGAFTDDAQLLRSLIDTAGSVIVGLRPDHTIFAWNRAAEELYGVAHAAALGTDYVERFIAPEHRAAVAGDIREVLAGKVTRGFEDDSILPDGSRRTLLWNVTRVLDVEGRPCGILANGQDITAIRQADTRLRLVFDEVQDGLLLADANGIIDCNPAALALLGLTDKAQLVGRRAFEFSPPLQPDGTPSEAKARALGQETLARGANTFDWVHRRSDGRDVPVEVSVRHAMVGGRRVSAIVWRDRTARVALESQQAAMQARLAEVQRLEATAQLAGGVAHDFNNLLTAIRNAVTLAHLALPAGSAAQRDLDIALDVTGRAARLTQQLLAFGRRQPHATERLCLAARVRELLPLLRSLLPAAVTLVPAIADDEVPVELERSQLEQVVLNLVLNARDAMATGGAVRLSVAVEGGTATLRVSDTGTGIPPEVLPHIFEPFYTTKPAGSGSGLGLAVVHGVVTQAGGTVEVSSPAGGGTVVTVRLPASTRAPEAAVPAATSGENRRTLLLVEDQAPVRDTTRRLLERAGWQVVTAEDGEAGWLAFERARPALAAVVTDLRMPRLDGAQLAARIRAHDGQLPIVFVSGYEESRDDVPPLAGTRFLRKPFAIDELTAVLDAVAPAA